MDTQQWLLHNSFWTGYLGHIFAALLYRCCPFLPAGVKLMVAFLNFPPNMKHFFPFTFWPLYVQYTASILVLLFHTARNWTWHMWVFAKLNFFKMINNWKDIWIFQTAILVSNWFLNEKLYVLVLQMFIFESQWISVCISSAPVYFLVPRFLYLSYKYYSHFLFG